MLKGHVAIELKDVNTGEVQRIEGDNMVTNGIDKYFKFATARNFNYGARSRNGNAGNLDDTPYLPVATRMLGGLYIFGNSRTESADNLSISLEDDVMAVCGDNTDTHNMIGGIYNTIESGETETGYRHIWDFGTAQSVGTIRSLSLGHTATATNLWGEDCTMGASFSSEPMIVTNLNNNKQLSNAGTPYPIYFDEESEYLYCVGISSAKVTIKKFKLNLLSVKLAELPVTLGEPEDVLEYNFSTSQSVNEISITDDIANKKQHIFHSYTTTSFSYVTIDLSNLNSIQVTEHTISGLPAFTSESSKVPCFCGNYLYYVKSWSDKLMAKVNVADLTDYTELNTNFSPVRYGYTYVVMKPAANIAVHLYHYSSYPNSGNSKGICYSIKDDYIGFYSANSSITHSESGYKIHPMLLITYSTNGGWSILRLCTRFLATIFNLSSPVTKTSAQTMKVIYTLTDSGSV